MTDNLIGVYADSTVVEFYGPDSVLGDDTDTVGEYASDWHAVLFANGGEQFYIAGPVETLRERLRFALRLLDGPTVLRRDDLDGETGPAADGFQAMPVVTYGSQG